VERPSQGVVGRVEAAKGLVTDQRGTVSASPRTLIERCGTCGFVGAPDKYIPHDCYWVFRERMYGKIGAEPGDVDSATQPLASSVTVIGSNGPN